MLAAMEHMNSSVLEASFGMAFQDAVALFSRLFLVYFFPVAIITSTVMEGRAAAEQERLDEEARSSGCDAPGAGSGKQVLAGSQSSNDCRHSVKEAPASMSFLRRFWERFRRLSCFSTASSHARSAGRCVVNVVHAVFFAVAAVVLLVRLVAFALMLAPWFICHGRKYFTNPRIIRGVRFGSSPRNFADIYLPPGEEAAGDRTYPVVVAVMGGAWLIGHRIWNCQFAARLAQAGVVVVTVDYRNFPAVQLADMMEDVERGVLWAMENAGIYGGDVGRVALIGQSAGAHLAAQLVVERCVEEAQRADAGASSADGSAKVSRPWSPASLVAFVGVSGVYDLEALEAHLLGRRIVPFVRRICPGGDLMRWSPVHFLREEARLLHSSAVHSRMPPIHLFHGDADNSAPVDSVRAFAQALRGAGARNVRTIIKPGLRHSEPVVEHPIRGEDTQVQLLLPLLFGEEEGRRRYAALAPPRCPPPQILTSLASIVMPF